MGSREGKVCLGIAAVTCTLVAVGRRGSCDRSFGNNVSCLHLHLCVRGTVMSLLLWGKLRTIKMKTVLHFDSIYFQLCVLVFETFKGWISWMSPF